MPLAKNSKYSFINVIDEILTSNLKNVLGDCVLYIREYRQTFKSIIHFTDMGFFCDHFTDMVCLVTAGTRNSLLLKDSKWCVLERIIGYYYDVELEISPRSLCLSFHNFSMQLLLR